MQYFWIKDLKKIGKIDNFVPYLFDLEEGWVIDNENILMDRVIGYDDETIGGSSIYLVNEITKLQAYEIIKKLKNNGEKSK